MQRKEKKKLVKEEARLRMIDSHKKYMEQMKLQQHRQQQINNANDDYDDDDEPEQVERKLSTGLDFSQPDKIIKAGLGSDQTGNVIKLGYVILKNFYGM